uniref:Neuromedin-B receptor n=1 Tax=Rattus norvegicus TaxID=10116 RepID=F1M5M1_RAT
MPPRSLPNLSLPTEASESELEPEVWENDFLPDSDGTTAELVIRCVIPSLYLIIISVGLLGNIMLVKIFLTNSTMRSVPNIFISNLAAGDLLLLLTCVPVDASRYFFDEWVFGKLGCKLIPAIQLTSVGVSVFTLTALSADSFKMVVEKLDFTAAGSLLQTICKKLGLWICVCLLAVPERVFGIAIGSSDNSFTVMQPYRTNRWSTPKIHSCCHIFIVYFTSIPLVIIQHLLYHIAKLIRMAHNPLGEYNDYTQKAEMETRKRLAKIVLVFVGCFVFCWFPNHILYLYRSFNYKEIDPSLGHMIVTLVARVLSFSNSCVNPFALYLLSESFRKHFNSQLCCGQKSYPERSTSYLLSSSAVRMTSLKSNAKNVVTNSVLLNGHSTKQEIAL